MASLFMFEKPLGMRDSLPSLYEKKRTIRESLATTIRSWGYRYLQTPTLEYYETVGAESAISDPQLFKLLDQQGHTLVLRPDMTAPIARIAASRFQQTQYPLRLAYDGNVFRAQEREGGKPAEFEQVGIELIGDGSVSADAEVLSLMVESLHQAGVKEFTVAVGHVGFLNGLFEEIVGKRHAAGKLLQLLYEKNFVGYKEAVDALSCSVEDKEKLTRILTLRSAEDWFSAAAALSTNGKAINALRELQTLMQYVKDDGLDAYVKVDVSLVSHMSYYTGILFEGYARDIGSVLCNGGRYNDLMGKFERDTQATGFGIRLDRLAAVSELVSNEPLPIIILFSPSQRKEAIQKARALRNEGKHVIVQEQSSLENIDDIADQACEVLDYTDGKKEG